MNRSDLTFMAYVRTRNIKGIENQTTKIIESNTTSMSSKQVGGDWKCITAKSDRKKCKKAERKRGQRHTNCLINVTCNCIERETVQVFTWSRFVLADWRLAGVFKRFLLHVIVVVVVVCSCCGIVQLFRFHAFNAFHFYATLSAGHYLAPPVPATPPNPFQLCSQANRCMQS